MPIARSSTRFLLRVTAWSLIGAAALLGGCDPTGPETPPAGAQPAAFERSQHTSSGDSFLDVTTSLDRTELSVADRATLSLVCTTRASAVVALPEFKDHLGDMTIASVARNERRLDAGRKQLEYRIVLEPFLAGAKKVPAFAIESTDNGATLKLSTDPLSLNVRSVADDKADAKTPLDPAKLPVAYVAPPKPNHTRSLVLAGGGVLAALAACGFAAFTAARRARREASPVYRVRKRLESVRTSLGSATTAAEAAVAAEDLFRALAGYLSQLLNIPADTQPHPALAERISACSPLTPAERREVDTLLLDLERARFAPDGVSVAIVQALLDRTTSFVDRTAPLEVQR